MPTMLFLLMLTLLMTQVEFSISSSTQIKQHRRMLHQPFFPSVAAPTIQPPLVSPQQQPQPHPIKYPFSSTTTTTTTQSPPNPFFPFYPSPPPPPPSTSSLATFPANISSLILPQSSSSSSTKPISRKFVAVAVAVSLLSLSFIVFIAALLVYHRRRSSSTFIIDKKNPRSDNIRLFPPNTATSDGGHTHTHTHKQQQQQQPSSSDPPTLGNSRSIFDEEDAQISSSSNVRGGYQKLGSPELHPLPPLPRHNNFRQNAAAEDDDEEEFFSPRSGSFGGGSPSVVVGFEEVVVGDQYLGSSSSSSNSKRRRRKSSINSRSSSSSSASGSSYPQSSSSNSSGGGSPVQGSMSSTSTTTRSSSIPPPSRPAPPIPTPVTSSSSAAGGKLPPPPPPPLPPPRFWETPVPVVVLPRPNIVGPPVLMTPSRSVVFQNGHTEQVSSPTGSLLDTMEKIEEDEEGEETPKPKLKPLHWDKVRASSDRAMVWDQLKSSSFQLNEEMIETLFMVNGSNLTSKDRPVLPSLNQEYRVLDPKKSQNIAILLRALNVTIDEVCEALLEGNADTLGTELLESLLKMAPTKEEERKLREFKDESPFKLGPAEKFLKAVLHVPFAFKRVDAMLYIANFDSEVEYLTRSFQTLEAACEELRNSRMLMKLLEAVLKTGNRMNIGTNRGDAQAFKLDTLLKLVDIKGTDGKTTLLHFVVQEIIRAEGSRLSGANLNSEENHQSDLRDDVEFRKLGLLVVSGLSGELTNVKKAAAMESDILSSEVEKLAGGITKIVDVLKLNEELGLKDNTRKFFDSVIEFLKKAEADLIKIQAQESVALSLVKEITEYFHGNSAKEEAHPFRIFMVVRDFLLVLDQVCKEVGKVNERSIVSSARQFPLQANPNVPPIFPGFNGKQHYSSDDDDDGGGGGDTSVLSVAP